MQAAHKANVDLLVLDQLVDLGGMLGLQIKLDIRVILHKVAVKL